MHYRPIALTDLDDTLFQTRRKMPEGATGEVAAVSSQGNPAKASLMMSRQQALYAWLSETCDLIPVTARSVESFSRVQLAFGPWAIVSNGAVILHEGKPDPLWQANMVGLLTPLRPVMEMLLEEGRDNAACSDLDLRSWIVEEAGLATYVVFKLNMTTPEAEKALQNMVFSADLSGWLRHYNSETLALIPPGSGKAAAVEHLLAHLDPDRNRPVIGIGDSLSDLAFMKLGDMFMAPSHSQIARSL